MSFERSHPDLVQIEARLAGFAGIYNFDSKRQLDAELAERIGLAVTGRMVVSERVVEELKTELRMNMQNLSDLSHWASHIGLMPRHKELLMATGRILNFTPTIPYQQLDAFKTDVAHMFLRMDSYLRSEIFAQVPAFSLGMQAYARNESARLRTRAA